MKRTWAIVIAGLMTVCVLNGCNGDPPKIAVVDLNRVISDSIAGKKANAELNALVKAKREEVKKEAQGIVALKKRTAEESGSARKSDQAELEAKTAEYEKLVLKDDADVRNKAAALKAGLLKDINDILAMIGASQKYAAIITAQSAPYFNKQIDITDTVIMRYNKLQGTK